MFIRRSGLLGILELTAISALVTVVAVNAWSRAPAPVYRERPTRTYRFASRITSNGGVTPFEVGETIKGTFTYDLGGENIWPEFVDYGRYRAKRNSIVFRLGDLEFAGTGEVKVTIGVGKRDELFRIAAPDLKLPQGWDMEHTERSQEYSFVLQNAPPKQVFRRLEIPDRLSLADFPKSREVRLDFFHGVRFPGGEVKGRATVYATVESLD